MLCVHTQPIECVVECWLCSPSFEARVFDLQCCIHRCAFPKTPEWDYKLSEARSFSTVSSCVDGTNATGIDVPAEHHELAPERRLAVFGHSGWQQWAAGVPNPLMWSPSSRHRMKKNHTFQWCVAHPAAALHTALTSALRWVQSIEAFYSIGKTIGKSVMFSLQSGFRCL